MLKTCFRLLGNPRVYSVLIVFLGLLAVILFIRNPFYLNILFMILLYAGLSGAWNIIGGFGGQLSLGHSAFFGIGAYTSGLLFVKCGIPPILGIFAGVGTASLLAAVIGIPCFRLKGPFFSLATIAIAEVLQLLAVYFKKITEGSEGLSIPFQPSFYNLIFESRNHYALVGFFFLLLVLAVSYWIQNSKLGYQLAALRDEDQAAETLGVNTLRAKMTAFWISGALTAVGATLFSQYILFLEPHSEFSINVSVNLALISMIGGLGTCIGPVIGSFLLIPLQEFLRMWIGGKYQGLHFVVYGGLLIAVVMFMPQGIIAFFSKKYESLLLRLPSFSGSPETSRLSPMGAMNPGSTLFSKAIPVAGENEAAPILEVENLSKNFGGLKAISNLTFSVRQGEILGIIGPNGAGKTTLFNILSGVYKPDRGTVKFQGPVVSRLNKAHILCRAGIGRTYQLVKPFENMTVLENVMVGAFCRQSSRKKARDTSLEILQFVGLAQKKGMLANEITLADKKRLEMARVLATQPRLLLLDEVMAGLTPVEVQETGELIRKIRDSGQTVIIIEHVMQAIMSLSDRVLVLSQGEKITEGRAEEVIRDARVIKAYLGESNDSA
jgi:branched-chain amino acid transport system permease protein